jgi:hypothetical protein
MKFSVIFDMDGVIVDEATNNRGGLSVYGKNSGRYPMDLSIVIKEK